MKKSKHFVWLLFFGSLWGMSELVGGGILYDANVAYTSVWLSAWAFFILAAARALLNKPGTSLSIGAIAALFKLVYTGPFFCHICGILLLGVAFDIAATLLMKQERKVSLRSSLTGILSAYGGYTLFALVITYIIRYEYWVEGGLAKVLDHIFVSGSFAALIALVIVPLGYWVGLNGGILVQRRSRWAYSCTLVASVILWTVGRLIG